MRYGGGIYKLKTNSAQAATIHHVQRRTRRRNVETHIRMTSGYNRQQIARKHRAADHRERDEICQDHDGEHQLHVDGDARALGSIALKQRRQKHCAGRAQGEHEEVQVSQQMPQPDEHRQHHPQRIQRGRRVVAQVFRIAEDVSRHVLVIGQPADQRNRAEKPN